MKPTIGRIVHFVDDDGSEWPAVITRVFSDTRVNLQVFRDSDVTPRTSVPLIEVSGDPSSRFSWHWPQRA
jgi:hypothetical protein